MKKIRMIVSAFAVFAVVGSALAFTKVNPNLYICSESNTCNLQNFSTFPRGAQVDNPGNLYKLDASGTCGSGSVKCSPYDINSPVFQNN